MRKKNLSFIIYHWPFSAKQGGFTLIELLVVISIIGIMAGLSLFAVQGARESGRDARRKSDLESIRSALEIYKADCGRYPGAITAGAQLPGDGANCPATNIYIEEVPDDPLAGRNYDYLPSGAPPTTYLLCAGLEGETTADADCTAAFADCDVGITCSYSVNNP